MGPLIALARPFSSRYADLPGSDAAGTFVAMEPLPQLERPPVPVASLLLSFGALLVPAVVTLFFADAWGPYEALLWLVALVPAFLLAYYRGWKGVALALAAGMAVLATVQLVLVGLGRGIERDALFGGVITAYIGTGLGLGILAELIHRERERAEGAALTDPLTGVPNRRYAELVLRREFAGAQRGRELTLVIFDLDHFKDFNDVHGHAAGDQALRRFARVLMSQTRTMNLSSRWGGEEFLAVLSSTPDTGAQVFADRVRQALASEQERERPFTVTAGIAQYTDAMESPRDLLQAADEALYAGKSAGRDRTAVYAPDGTSRVQGAGSVD